MPFSTLPDIEKRITEVQTSYQRQVSLAGKPGYDHSLAQCLKKDLDWLQEQKLFLENQAVSQEEKQGSTESNLSA